METFESMLMHKAQRELLRYACGRAIYCPICGAVLDAPNAVLLMHGTDAAIACAPCSGRMPGTYRVGGAEVLDGRTLFAPRDRPGRASVS